MTLLRVLTGVAGALFVLSLPVLFGTLSLRWLVSDAGWYRAGFEKHGVSARTGMAPEELGRAAGHISNYLVLGQESIDIPVKVGTQTLPLFNDREIRHMKDVQDLLRGFYSLQAVAAGYALLYLAGAALVLKGRFWSALGSKLRWGGGLTLGLFGVFGLLSTLNFDELFLRFHLVSFDNDLWMLDPTKDRLIMMFPQGFWYDSAIRLALLTVTQALGAVVVGTLLRRKPPAVGSQPQTLM